MLKSSLPEPCATRQSQSAVGPAVYETAKNVVTLHEHRVDKRAKPGRAGVLRIRREAAALQRIAGIPGVPRLLAFDRAQSRVELSRLPGRALAEVQDVPDAVFLRLREIVERMLERGVARHSLPARDVIVHPGGGAGLCDFERSTLRRIGFSPVWLVACAITRFHLLRLIEARAPHLLSASEQRTLRWQWVVRNTFRKVLEFRRCAVRAIRRE